MRWFPFEQRSDILFVLFGLVFVVFGWFALSLTLGSLFLFPLVFVGMTLFFGVALFILWKLLVNSPLDVRIALVVTLAYAILIGSFSTPTVFSGRDQGSIAEAALRLSEHGQLAFSTAGSEAFFQIYGSGTALNFPGFAYTTDGDLITQFPLGYTGFLASFVSLFGLSGITLGNTLLLFLSLFTLYQLFRLFVSPWYASAGLLVALTSFLPEWFAKFALTENLGLFLFLFLLYNVFLFLREGKFVSYAGILLSAGLFTFTRFEGFLFLPLVALVLFFSPYARNIWKTYPVKSLVLPAAVYGFFLLRDFFLNVPYYKMIAKAFLKFVHGIGSDVVTTNASFLSGNTFTLGSLFFLYGFLILFVAGTFGYLVFAKKRERTLFLPLLIALPTLLYLFSPNITLDHPWMLRRFLFTLFPLFLFGSVVGIALLFAKHHSYPLERPRGKRAFFVSLLFAGLILLQLPAWSRTISFSENRDLLPQIEQFSKNFSERDLILVDRFATGSGFSMLTGPAQTLFHRNAVYFFNPADLDKLDRSLFEHTYLLVPQGSEARYVEAFGDRLTMKGTFTFTTKHLELLSATDSSTLRLPEQIETRTVNTLYEIH